VATWKIKWLILLFTCVKNKIKKEDPMTFALGKAHKQGHYQNEGMCEVVFTLHNDTLICSNVDDCRLFLIQLL
jgi:hypothetical protein